MEYKGLLVKGKPNKERKNCYDCDYCVTYVTHWCTNDEAVKVRGTKIPGVIKCPFWKPVKTIDELSLREKISYKLGLTTYIELKNED